MLPMQLCYEASARSRGTSLASARAAAKSLLAQLPSSSRCSTQLLPPSSAATQCARATSSEVGSRPSACALLCSTASSAGHKTTGTPIQCCCTRQRKHTLVARRGTELVKRGEVGSGDESASRSSAALSDRNKMLGCRRSLSVLGADTRAACQHTVVNLHAGDPRHKHQIPGDFEASLCS